MIDALAAAPTMVPNVPTPLPTPLDEALDALFALTARTLQARRCSLYLRPTGGAGDTSLLLCKRTGLTSEEGVGAAPTEATILGLVARARVPLLVQDIAAYPALPTHPERYATASFVSVPILVENEAAGVLNAADRHDGQPFSENDLQGAELVARALATVLHGDLLVRRALDEGEIDPVTSLYNRRHLQHRMRQERERARRSDTPLALLLLAVGGYGEVAAHAGAQTAGVLMRCVGELVGRVVRQSDIVALYESDRIAILLPDTAPDAARQVARTIVREMLHEKLPAHLRYDCERLDISLGVASSLALADEASLERRAEEALRMALARGDGIVVAEGAGATRHTSPRAGRDMASLAREIGVPYLADPAAVATAAAVRLLSPQVARSYLCFPVAFEGGTLTLAMVNPLDAAAIHAVSQLTGMAVYPVACPRAQILRAIARLLPVDSRDRRDGRDDHDDHDDHENPGADGVLLHALRDDPDA